MEKGQQMYELSTEIKITYVSTAIVCLLEINFDCVLSYCHSLSLSYHFSVIVYQQAVLQWVKGQVRL